jgi:5-formyltetrahydrofolate cyclo-ligase
MSPSKAELRAIFRKKRTDLSKNEIEVLSQKINRQVQSFCKQHPELNHFHLFLPIERLREVDTHYIMEYLFSEGKNIYASQINRETDEMETILLEPAMSFKLDDFGIPIPQFSQNADDELLQVVFVPLLAVDLKGNRIGYGKGYYDRFLAKIDADVLKIGLSFFEPVKEIPEEDFDIKCDYCITPNAIITF